LTGVSARRPTGPPAGVFVKDPRFPDSRFFISNSRSFCSFSNLSFSAFSFISFSFCSFSFSSFSAWLAEDSDEGEFEACALLITPRYQNIKLLINTCSYKGRLGFASLI
jgi:hypothetical protein